MTEPNLEHLRNSQLDEFGIISSLQERKRPSIAGRRLGTHLNWSEVVGRTMPKKKNRGVWSPQLRNNIFETYDRLIKLSQEGDREAFSELCELRRRQLVGEVSKKIDRRLLPRVDASDVIQEVFLDAHRRLPELVGTDMPLIAWLRFLCNQKLVDLHRKHVKAKKRSTQREQAVQKTDYSWESIAETLVANASSPSTRAEKNEMAIWVKEHLGKLSPIDREVLVLRHFHSMNNSEVAETLGLTINAASNRYVRALVRFKKAISP